MCSYSKESFLSLLLLVPFTTWLSAEEGPLRPDNRRDAERHPFLLRLAALPIDENDPFGANPGFEDEEQEIDPLDPLRKALAFPRDDSASEREKLTWPDPLQPLDSDDDSPARIWREQRYSERESELEMEPLDLFRDKPGFPEEKAFEDQEERVREVHRESAASRLRRLWQLEKPLWSVHLYGGQNFTDTLGEVIRGDTHRHSSQLASLGAVRDGGPMFGILRNAWWWPTWEMEYTFTRRFEGSSFNEHNIAPVRMRWDFPLGKTLDRYLELAFAVSEGISIAERIPKVEINGREDSHELQNFLALDVILGLPLLEKIAPFTKNLNVFFRIHHRSDVYGLYPEDGGSNTLTGGISIGRLRTRKRWADRSTSSLPEFLRSP